MKIREFEALTLKDCLGQVRQELGPEAVILETRKFRKGGILGWGARDAVRIVAGTGITVNDEDRRQASKRSPANRPAVAAASVPAKRISNSEDTINPACPATQRNTPDIAAFLAKHAALSAEARESGPTEDAEARQKLTRLETEVREMKAALTTLGSVHAVVGSQIRSVEGSVRFPELAQRLRDADVQGDLADELLEHLPNPDRWSPDVQAAMAEQALREQMAARIRVADSIETDGKGPKVAAFVGPTGVGKTTTIAKLAAQQALVHKRSVGLITMDTYRIAAVEQLKSYAQIIGIPVEVVHNQSEIGPALARLNNCDLILIDTAGRSQKNVMQVSELKSLVDAARCETHLVLAASTRERDMLDQVERFSRAAVDRLVFTKLDETMTYGTLFDIAARTAIPVSYLAMGQKVPEDIEPATIDGIVDRVLAVQQP